MPLYNAKGNLLVVAGDITGKGVYAANGSLRITSVDGTTRVGRYAADGSLNVIIVAAAAAAGPLLHASGATRVVETTNQTGGYAPNGALYVSGAETAPAIVEGVLDGMSATGAWSLSRKLITAYAGEKYDQTSAAVTTLYDQSGNARNLTDGSVAARRPAVSTAGLYSRTCADFDGATDYLTGSAMSSHVGISNKFIVISAIFDTVSLVEDVTFVNQGHGLIADESGGRVGLFGAVGGGVDKIFATNYDGAANDDHVGQTVIEGQVHVMTLRHEGGTLYVSVDNSVETSVASGATSGAMGLLRIGFAGTGYLDGKVFEAATFSTVPSLANRTSIVTAFRTHVGNVRLLEDGTSYRLLEDGSSYRLLE